MLWDLAELVDQIEFVASDDFAAVFSGVSGRGSLTPGVIFRRNCDVTSERALTIYRLFDHSWGSDLA